MKRFILLLALFLSGTAMAQFKHPGLDQSAAGYNNGFGLESYATAQLKQENNLFGGNGNTSSQQKISNEKYIVME
ncbi:hypothetical protein [Chitinophaga sp. 22620]|uniref:hypothetical protein n=1 Tax=Chitinophaga sp. 22620 TaxID=3453952 RepID=UPI003F84C891